MNMFDVCLAALVCSLTHAAQPAPPLPKQTPTQSHVIGIAKTRADADSRQGLAELMSILESKELNATLDKFDDGSGLQHLSASQLLQRLESELSVAELVHNFGLEGDGNCGMDVTLDSGPGQPYFFNQWMLQTLGYVPVDGANNIFTESSETRFFHFPPFKNVSQPDWNTSASRPVYAAINMFRGSGGNPQCGPISAVYSRKYIDNQAIVAPIDTGLFIGVCGDGQESGWFGFKCHSWPTSNGTLGVLDDLLHLLPVYLKYYNTTEAVTQDYPAYNLGRLLTRLLSRKTYTHPAAALKLTFVENTLGYLEANPLVTMAYPASIKLMIAAYDVLFGTSQGERLRQWCIAQDWPLAWAHNPSDSTWRCSPDPTKGCAIPPARYLYTGLEPANVRILDPYVLSAVTAGKNATRDRDWLGASAIFNASWKQVNTSIPASASVQQRRKLADIAWIEMMATTERGVWLYNSSLAIEPLFAGACQDTECVGVRVSDGACVC
eukprot:TRINITY_DN2822_c0_g1_i1.p1 TRINITY_DN2822_c0_g1~~TRINITY_DN2822_c0_g1_i1.p1  ORF type:complete len:494 (+),score=97.98 TRINITY_DN2822_c0_g1_i1:40-1521(+)